MADDAGGLSSPRQGDRVRPLVLDSSERASGSTSRKQSVKLTWTGSPERINSTVPSDLDTTDDNCDNQSVLSFADGVRFQTGIGIVIFVNIFVLWGETDFPELAVWSFLDNAFLLIFIVEIALKVALHKSEYFTGRDMWWSFLDCTIVVLGVFDLWAAPLLRMQGEESSINSPVFRFLRLLRLLRLLRVFKMFKRLYHFLQALVVMFSTFVWIFSVLFLFILANAIILTNLLGHGHGSAGQESDYDASTQLRFADVSTSLFTLFQVTTADNWDDVAGPLIELDKRWRFFFVFFICFASWTMISVLTAVASDSMVAASSDKKHEEQAEQESKQREFMNFLRTAFQEADEDGNGLLDKGEFNQLTSQQEVTDQMRRLGIHMSQDELSKAWDMLDIEESGTLTIDEFVTGLSHLQEGLQTKHVVNVDYSLKKIALNVEKEMDTMIAQVNSVRTQNSCLLDAVKLQEAAYEKMEVTAMLWQKWASLNTATLDGERERILKDERDKD